MSDTVDLTDPHEQYKLLEALHRIERVGGIVSLPPDVDEAITTVAA